MTATDWLGRLTLWGADEVCTTKPYGTGNITACGFIQVRPDRPQDASTPVTCPRCLKAVAR